METIEEKKRFLRTIVCDVCLVSWSDITSKSRKNRIVLARHLYCFFSSGFLKMHPHHIGVDIDRDRTTVLNSLEVVVNLVSTGHEDMTRYFNAIQNIIAKQ